MLVRVTETNATLQGLTTGFLHFDDAPAALALAFISPHLDFPEVCRRLRELAGDVPMVAVTTAGELCATGADCLSPLYRPTGGSWDSVVVQCFSPALIDAVSIHAVPLHNEDIRQGAPSLRRSERVGRIAHSLADVDVPFTVDCHDTLALTFIDGLSACEGHLMEAVYHAGRFPCLFIGGSAGGKLDFRHTYLSDGSTVLENHALICFMKLPPDKRYGVFKSQNFRTTDKSFIVLEADPDRRTVSSVVDPATFQVETVVAAMCRLLECTPPELEARMADYTFAIELDGEIFVRSISSIDVQRGMASFYCDVNTGDRLFLQQATDFAAQTRADYAQFLKGKPSPLGGVINDCILRRLANEAHLGGLDGLWTCPTAGFSTFGELLGININQTLTAVFFFDVADGQDFTDAFVEGFPVHYGRFQNYFTMRRLARLKLLNELRSQAAGNLIDHFAELSNCSEELAPIVTHARMERALRDSRSRLLAMSSSLYEGVMLIDPDGGILFANRAAARLLEDNALTERRLDEVMMLVTQGERSSLLLGPLRRTLEHGETVLDEDVFVVTGAGHRLNVAYAAAPLQEAEKTLGLILSFRSIEALKKAQRDAVQASRLASVGQLAAGIAHEINTPIQYISDNLAYIHDSLGDATTALARIREAVAGSDRAELVERILADQEVDYLLRELPLAAAQSLDGAKHVAHIVRSMKTFSHPGTTAKVRTDINQAIDSTLTVSCSEWKHVASVETAFAEDLPPVVCFPADINQVLLNLIVNAAQAIAGQQSPQPGLIRLATRRDGDYVEIRVRDSGPGVPPEFRDQIFDPFFTTKDVGKGTGQGLAICLDVVTRKHGGQLFLDDSQPGGATFVVRLPIEERES